MKMRPLILFGALTLTAGLAFAQDEQSSSRSQSPSARFWTQPRVELTSPATGTEAAPATERAARGEDLTIENETLQARWNPGSGAVTLVYKPSAKSFLEGTLNAPTGTGRATTADHPTFGSGRALEISYPNGERDQVMLFPRVPFALFRSTLHNGGSQPTLTRTVRPFRGAVNLSQPAAQLRAFGTGGLSEADDNPGSYTWLAIAEPQTRNGVVLGWFTQERGNGVLFSRVEGNTAHVGGQIDYGRLRLAPGKTEDLETLAVGYFDDARLGLEIWADHAAKVNNVKLKEQPTGYCTWYSRPHGGASDEQHLAELSEFSAKELKPYGFSVVQIDDGWQAGYKRARPSSPKKDFRTHNPEGSYPGGMKAIADEIKADGLVPGIWFMPFAGTSIDPFFTNHLDWFVKDANGNPYDTSWGGTSLDMSHPGARAHLRDVAGRICRDWGFEYIKIDGLWTGTATAQLYVNSGYRQDDIGEAVFHDPDITNIEAYRSGLKLVRESIGSDVYILGCNGPQNMRSYGGAFGLVDGMRVGPDNNSEWNRLTRGPLFGSRHYFMHGRMWHNDPDPVYVRDSMPLKHAQLVCSWVAVSGQLNLSSEWLPGLPPERLNLLKRTMPSHGLLPRPADLFDQNLPSVWLVTDERRGPRRDVVGLFNWENSEREFDYPLNRLGLDAGIDYVAFDYWADALVPSVRGNLKLTVPAQACAILAVRPKADRPQLISTSRHVTQGIVDVIEEKWDASSKTLSGRSEVIGADPYELRVVTPGNQWTVKAVEVSAGDRSSGVKTSFQQADGLVRTSIETPATREVAWSIQFN